MTDCYIDIKTKMILGYHPHHSPFAHFWFINSLFKIGEEEKAMEHFDKLLSYSNHLGLFSEDIDFKTKRLLGNFPQAYSHLALIECAVNFSNKDTEEKILESMRE